MTGWDVLVVDDSVRFPLHVWRYLSDSIGFGIGDVAAVPGHPEGAGVPAAPPDRPREAHWIEFGRPLLTDDGRNRLWWVPADKDWERKLDHVLARLGSPCRVYALVDIHGKQGYSVENARRRLERLWQQPQVERFALRTVSAYYFGSRFDRHLLHRRLDAETARPGDAASHAEAGVKVLPKSRETLRSMIRELGLGGDSARIAVPAGGVRHVLITGAGFEIRGDRGGIGMPPTGQVLGEMGSPFRRDKEEESADTDLLLESLADGGFPVPAAGIWRTGHKQKRLRTLARDKDLDAYWNLLLGGEFEHIIGRVVDSESELDETKAEALWREMRLRDAFRRSILRYDWGYMNQSLTAARLPLHSWLTTNYTHFANRAIALYADVGQTQLGYWRIIATAAEAGTLTKEHLRGSGKASRLLFKLHGDISHLQTMAIAGQDKDRFSLLSMPVEDLYQVYAAAERFLIESLNEEDVRLVIWHVVGHGLQDRRLCELIGQVAYYTKIEKQIFAVIDRAPDDPSKLIKDALKKKGVAPLACKLDAVQYMACLWQLLCGKTGDWQAANDPIEKERLRKAAADAVEQELLQDGFFAGWLAETQRRCKPPASPTSPPTGTL